MIDPLVGVFREPLLSVATDQLWNAGFSHLFV